MEASFISAAEACHEGSSSSSSSIDALGSNFGILDDPNPAASPAKIKEAGGRKKRMQSSNGIKEVAVAERKKLKTDGYLEMADQPRMEPMADYIHVRARRGQATDKHSLAERVRREKISQRMKVLQSLVPGCDKVTGKALVLDEIINYVLSLQYQVEFLSMKLGLVTPAYADYEFDTGISPTSINQEAAAQQHQRQLMDHALPSALHFQGSAGSSMMQAVEEDQWHPHQEEQSAFLSN